MKKTLVGVALIAMLVAAYFVGRNGNFAASVSQAGAPEAKLENNPEAPGQPVLKFGVFDSKASAKLGQPLPAANLPLSEIYSELQQRADDGNGQAACRLAMELVRCRHFNIRAKYLVIDPSDYQHAEQDSLKDRLTSENGQDEERLTILERNKSCAGISEDQFKQTFKYLRQGAYAGEPDALIPYIAGDGLADDFSRIRSRDFDVWRSDALPLAQSAMRGGYPATVVMLASAYHGDDDYFSGLVSNDPFQAEVMRQLYSRLFAIPASEGVSQLSAEQNRMASNQAEQLFQQRFQGRILPRGLSLNPTLRLSSSTKDERAPCEH